MNRLDNLFLTKLDPSWSVAWNTTFGWQGQVGTPTGMVVHEGYVYVSGNAGLPSQGRGVFLTKFGPDGERLWNTTYGESGLEWTVGGTSWYGGTIYVLGFTRRPGVNREDVMLLRFDESGRLLGNATWGGDGYEVGVDAFISDGAMYIVGSTNSFGTEGYTVNQDGTRTRTTNVFLMKVSLGESNQPAPFWGSWWFIAGSIVCLIVGVSAITLVVKLRKGTSAHLPPLKLTHIIFSKLIPELKP